LGIQCTYCVDVELLLLRWIPTVKNECALSNQTNCGNRLQAILLIKFNKLELSNNESN